ncbi:MAG: helix-turn-helix transcriptional regulator [Bacteroidota bacterium]|nr:helix-turn-helix transcriptional regulator [Bacteroidota bacterium]
MNNKEAAILPKLRRILEGLGENIKYARLRRKYNAEQVSERANISRNTLWQIEKGSPSVSMGAYAQVLFVLGLEKDIELLGKDDVLGRKLQDAELKVSERAPKQKKKSNND